MHGAIILFCEFSHQNLRGEAAWISAFTLELSLQASLAESVRVASPPPTTASRPRQQLSAAKYCHAGQSFLVFCTSCLHLGFTLSSEKDRSVWAPGCCWIIMVALSS